MKFLSDAEKLNIVKFIHTLVWLIFVVAILYICYSGAFNRVSRLTGYCIGAVVVEGIVILLNKGKCPLTSLAGKYTNTHPIGFDILLPKWLAQYNKAMFSTIFLVGLSLVLWRTIYNVVT